VLSRLVLADSLALADSPQELADVERSARSPS
jgi:hypothetical protein